MSRIWGRGRRIKGKRGRGSYAKTIVFGILERNGKVYMEIVPDCSRATLQATSGEKRRGYNGLVDIGYSKHFRVDHRDNKFSNGRSGINGIESFWSFAKRRLQKFNGVSKKSFNLHLKEYEFRFNNREKDIYKILLDILRNNMLQSYLEPIIIYFLEALNKLRKGGGHESRGTACQMS